MPEIIEHSRHFHIVHCLDLLSRPDDLSSSDNPRPSARIWLKARKIKEGSSGHSSRELREVREEASNHLPFLWAPAIRHQTYPSSWPPSASLPSPRQRCAIRPCAPFPRKFFFLDVCPLGLPSHLPPIYTKIKAQPQFDVILYSTRMENDACSWRFILRQVVHCGLFTSWAMSFSLQKHSKKDHLIPIVLSTPPIMRYSAASSGVEAM